MQQWLESNVAKRGGPNAPDLGGTYGDVHDMLLEHVLHGTWNDTGVAMMDSRPHVCQCLEQRLPGHLHSLSLHVAADEAMMHVHGGPTIRINGEFSWPWGTIVWREVRYLPVKRHLGVADVFTIAFNMLTLLLVAYGMSNYREVRALW